MGSRGYIGNERDLDRTEGLFREIVLKIVVHAFDFMQLTSPQELIVPITLMHILYPYIGLAYISSLQSRQFCDTQALKTVKNLQVFQKRKEKHRSMQLMR